MGLATRRRIMHANREPAKVKVVTILAARELLDSIEQALIAKGASGYTVAHVDGRGRHGSRFHGWLSMGNVRVEALLASDRAASLLQQLSREYRGRELVAFAQDVEAIPPEHFD